MNRWRQKLLFHGLVERAHSIIQTFFDTVSRTSA